MEVLIAEDCNVSRRMLEASLQRWGFEVIATSDGHEAWEVIEQNAAVQLAVLDWMMPGLDGVEICRRVRQLPNERYLYVILLTGNTEREYLVEGFQAGADDFLTKPFDPKELEQRIRSGKRVVTLQRELLSTQASLQAQTRYQAELLEQLSTRSQTLAEEIAVREQAELDREMLEGKLIESARLAGMAEVATGVLHNVGNVLNSINVSSTLLMEGLQSSRVDSLARASGLLTERENDLVGFLTEDDRGRRFPQLLRQLSECLISERTTQMNELSSLIQNIQHVKEIINCQQSFTSAAGATEMVSLAELVSDALKLNGPQSSRHPVAIVEQYEDVPQLLTEKHKVLQILTNLVSNAKRAVLDHGGDDRAITLGVSSDGECISVEVSDTGVGIAPENLTRVFAHGFTTKKDGHGFGLHSSALAAQELGGSLSAQSDGPGCGATFILRLPLTQTSVSVI